MYNFQATHHTFVHTSEHNRHWQQRTVRTVFIEWTHTYARTSHRYSCFRCSIQEYETVLYVFVSECAHVTRCLDVWLRVLSSGCVAQKRPQKKYEIKFLWMTKFCAKYRNSTTFALFALLFILIVDSVWNKNANGFNLHTYLIYDFLFRCFTLFYC